MNSRSIDNPLVHSSGLHTKPETTWATLKAIPDYLHILPVTSLSPEIKTEVSPASLRGVVDLLLHFQKTDYPEDLVKTDGRVPRFATWKVAVTVANRVKSHSVRSATGFRRGGV